MLGPGPSLSKHLLPEAASARARCDWKVLTILFLLIGLCCAVLLRPRRCILCEDQLHLAIQQPGTSMAVQSVQPVRSQQFRHPAKTTQFMQQAPALNHVGILGRRIPITRAVDVAKDAATLRKAVDKYGDGLLEATATGEEAAVEFPPPLSGTQRLERALTFYSRVLPVLFRYKFAEVKLEAEKSLLGKEITEEEERAMWGEIDEWGSTRVSDTISDLKGFYVKTGQVISTRNDLFPEAYTSKLKQLQDGLEPMPTELVKAVVQQELLGGEPLSELFADFENEPLGAASIAQVHKATLLDGRTVAVKVQRPNIEPKLRGDIANLKRISKQLRESLPVDYYTVFCELGRALNDELNFLQEAQAMRKIAAAVSHSVDGQPADAPVAVPLPIGELVSQRVVVMDFVEGVPLNRLQETMKERNIDPNSPEAKIAGVRILDSLSQAFERMIFGAGFLHGDPHPGNIFVQQGAKVALIDCGQVKAIPRAERLRLARVIRQVAEYQMIKRDPKSSDADVKAAIKKLAEISIAFGLEFKELEDGKDVNELAAAVALLLFGDKDMELPGGYSTLELDDNSPIKLLTAFPQELVLLGRATVLLKGISARLDVPFSLADSWAPSCNKLIADGDTPKMPLWGKKESEIVAAMATANEEERFRMRDAVKPWAKAKAKSFGKKVFDWLPGDIQSHLKNKVAERMMGERERK